MKRIRWNPERRSWRGRSYKRGGRNIRALRDGSDAKVSK